MKLKKTNDGEEDGEEDETGEKWRIAGCGGSGEMRRGYNPNDWSRVALAGEGNSVSL